MHAPTDDPRVRLAADRPLPESPRCVLHWMQRAQRGRDNPAVDRAVEWANALGLPLVSIFGLTAAYPSAQRRHFRFLVDALPEVRADLVERGATFVVRTGDPAVVMIRALDELRPAVVVGDENPLRVGRLWREKVAEVVRAPFELVDADVVVPSELFPKEEFAARTLRPKLLKLRDRFLVPSSNEPARRAWTDAPIPGSEPLDPDRSLDRLGVGGIGEVSGYRGGPREAERRLLRFIDERLPVYHVDRNEPTPYNTSELSAHLHFGHLSPLTAALAAIGSDAPEEAKGVFLEELIVRRELAVNFVARNPAYDRLEGCPAWGRATLAKHARDPRPVLYDASALEAGETHDPLWNAAQREMVVTGRMHNYLRMYWAKKILEWSPDAESAFAVAVDLNDRYEMDGRDPNGYAGIAWAIGGKHDRPWGERPIFGTIRYMSLDSTRRKFDSAAYIRRCARLADG